MFERAFVVSSCLSVSCFSPISTFSLSLSTCSLSGTPSSMSSPPRVKTTALTHDEKYCPVAIYNPLTSSVVVLTVMVIFLWECTYLHLVEIRENPAFHDLNEN